MSDRHVTHLLTRYVHGQLRPEQQALVVNHVRQCARCRAALAREEQIARELRAELATIGRGRYSPVAVSWSAVWREINQPRRGWHALAEMWVPALTLALALAMTLAIALPVFAGERLTPQAALQQPLPVSMASPTPGATDTSEAPISQGGRAPLTVWSASMVGASPVPMPAVTVSPQAVSASFGQ